MKKTLLVAASVLCLAAGAGRAFAGSGDGPYGTPDSNNSLPPGFRNGTVTYDERHEVGQAIRAEEANPAPTYSSMMPGDGGVRVDPTTGMPYPARPTATPAP